MVSFFDVTNRLDMYFIFIKRDLSLIYVKNVELYKYDIYLVKKLYKSPFNLLLCMYYMTHF